MTFLDFCSHHIQIYKGKVRKINWKGSLKNHTHTKWFSFKELWINISFGAKKIIDFPYSISKIILNSFTKRDTYWQFALKIQDELIYKIMIILKMSEYIHLSDWKFNTFLNILLDFLIFIRCIFIWIEDIYCDNFF